CVKPSITQSSTETLLAEITLMPLMPVSAPVINSPRMRTIRGSLLVWVGAVIGISIVIPVASCARMDAGTPVPSIVIDFLIITGAKPPASSTVITPALAVFGSAPAKDLHGDVRLQGLESSPVPDTHVRVACA